MMKQKFSKIFASISFFALLGLSVTTSAQTLAATPEFCEAIKPTSSVYFNASSYIGPDVVQLCQKSLQGQEVQNCLREAFEWKNWARLCKMPMPQ
ncbi:MAG: hypothetical protein OM95_16115 [Bdellovibrio sp. ArHS]|uniref:hypothetical protein n=1 Tax=Bdellovibrio sp. ArHS TaxID=1569284 RepID=UPI0005837AB9|nr:hypothetical protein [Bdellovibrio sp. ArHS]KHD87150.1 MAG: hypothetical protein OM95_16115 [Bdellovibrio sp. ArHS]